MPTSILMLRHVRIMVWLPLALVLGQERAAAEGQSLPAEATLPNEAVLARLPPSFPGEIRFREHIFPLLEERCFGCHRGSGARAGYRLDLREEILGETNGSPLVRIGKSAESRLIHLVAGLVEDKVMPAEGERLSAEEIGRLRAWIDQGLDWDEELLPPPNRATAHWAFQPIRRPAVPRVENGHWVRTPVDAFIAAAHEAHGLAAAPAASRAELIRRLTLDLTGLPPSVKEVEGFLADESPMAYDKLVDRLLASPRYGERWGRHWLDVARWAESEGYEYDYLRPFAWRYRDYVVRSLSEDRPFDRFILEQVAGDELLPYTDENLIATGFLAAARYSSNEEDFVVKRNDVLVDITNATAAAFLGLTMQCAQCHNHKFDPISQRDYYRFHGFFVRGQVNDLLLKDPDLWKDYRETAPEALRLAVDLEESLIRDTRARLAEERRTKLSEEMRAALEIPAQSRSEAERVLAQDAERSLSVTTEDVVKAFSESDRELHRSLRKKIEELERSHPRPQTIGFYSPASAATPVEVKLLKGMFPLPYEPEKLATTESRLFRRGDPHHPGPEVGVGWPAVFGRVPEEEVARRPRTALGRWLISATNPLTARVWANRVWHYHFGRGLSATPGDFGVEGARPSHPELLDYFAAELLENGWSTKHLHRLIVRSSAYRQSSRGAAEAERLDPDNVYLWHWTPRRLEAEAIRDSLLAVSGELDFEIGGPSVALKGVDDQYKFNHFDTARVVESEGAPRRSLYLEQRRDVPPPMQRLLDGPAATESCARRYTSTVSLQSLYFLNSEFVLDRARAFASRVVAEAGPDDPPRQVDLAFRLALGRFPEDEEREDLLGLLERAGAFDRSAPLDPFDPLAPLDASREGSAASGNAGGSAPSTDGASIQLVRLCHTIMNLSEFIYVP